MVKMVHTLKLLFNDKIQILQNKCEARFLNFVGAHKLNYSSAVTLEIMILPTLFYVIVRTFL